MKPLKYKNYLILNTLRYFPLLVIAFLSVLSANAQKNDVVQFSGIIITEVNNSPVPYASIKIKSTYRGTIANTDGFFSLAIKKTDTVICSAVGFKRKLIVLPDNIEGKSFTTLIEMKADTLTYDETVIYPWPSPAKFNDAFLALDLKKDLYDRAMDNLSDDKMIRLSLNMGMDGRENQNYYMNQMARAGGYLGGQTNYAQFPGMGIPIPLSLLDPMAWYKFIKMLKKGGFKDKYKELRE